MKRKQILVRAITLGLLLAMPCGVWAETLSSDVTYENGLSVNNGSTLDGTEASRYNVTVKGTVSSDDDEYSVINQGAIKNVGTLTAESVWNQGSLEVKDLQTTGGIFLNDGTNTVATIGGANINCEGPDWAYPVIIDGGIVNNNGAELNIKGDVYDAGFFENHNESVINIDKGVTVTAGKIGGFYNTSTINAEEANLKLERNGGGWFEAEYVNGGYLNVKNLESSNIFTNYGELVVNGSFIFNNERPIPSGFINDGTVRFMSEDSAPIKITDLDKIGIPLNNSGAIYVASGSLQLEGIDINLQGEKAKLQKDENTKLKELSTNKTIGLYFDFDNLTAPSLMVDEQIKAKTIYNQYGLLETETLIVNELVNYGIDLRLFDEAQVERAESSIVVDNLQFSNKISNGQFEQGASDEQTSGVIQVKDSIQYTGDDKGSLENQAKIYLIGKDTKILGNIVIDNKYVDENIYGLIAKNAEGDKITNLTIEGTLNNSGVVAAAKLNVANGADGSDTQESKGFNVDNLNILDGGSFALNNAEYELQSIGVDANATLTAAGAVNDVQSVALADSATFKSASISMTKGGAVTSDGGALTTPVMSGESLTFNLQSGKAEQIKVTGFSGSDLTINVASLTPAQVVIGEMTGSGVTINGNSDITDSFESDNIEAGLQSLAYTASINKQSGDQSRKVASAAGKILGPTEAMTDAQNNIIKSSVKEGVNPANEGISEMSSIALMTWRQENNDMNKRLGELRDSAGEHGVWVRMTRGEAKYGNQNIKNQYNAYQLGYDEKLSVDKRWTVGAALTYTDAESSFGYGKGENKHKGLALYGSRLNDDGSFIDLIARYARLEHEYEVHGGAGKGDFDTNGYSLSAEYGKRFTKDNGLWIEPQVELTYGRVSSGSYLTNNGVRVQQDGMDSLVGRLGFALGKNLAQGKGNVYLRASYLYDFDGETDVRYNFGQQNKRFEQDLGGGWWEVGVGTNINLSDASHLYFDVEKTYGGDVATPWQWNAGVRWSF